MSTTPPKTIVIVGGGFSGTATAIHLLRQAGNKAIRLIIIERAPEVGRGLAYAKTAYPYILNVPASRMSATSSDPDEFLRFARSVDPAARADDFLPRSLYGDYLMHCLSDAIAGAPPQVTVEHRQGDVVDVVPQPNLRLKAVVSTGGEIEADDVVLALGNPPPRRLPGEARMHEAMALPGARGLAATTDGAQLPILIVGTGLSMADIVCEAVHRHPDVRIHAISRHGLVPPSQTVFVQNAFHDAAGRLNAATGSIARIVAEVRSLVTEAARSGSDWREVITHVRHAAPGLWQSLPQPERRRFLRHVKSYWDVHRHRLPALVRSRIEALRGSGQLIVHAGRVVELVVGETSTRATWVNRGTGELEILDVATVFNCTGPDYNLTQTTDPLWQALRARGLVWIDELGLGLRTGPSCEVVPAAGFGNPGLYYIGPMLRADHWEATAVGELRAFAERIARHLTSGP